MWRRFHSLEKNRLEIIEYVSTKPEAFIHQSRENEWSILQALRHIQLSEQGSLSYMHKKVLAGDAMKAAPILPPVLLTLMDGSFRSGLKFNAPVAIRNPPVTSLEELKNDWERTREEMKRFLNDYPDKWTKKAVYKHPFVGMLSLNGALRFFNIHQNQHIRQVHRIERALRS